LVDPTRQRPFGGVPAGTFAVIWVGETTVNVVGLSKNETRLAPVKFEPVIVTVEPTAPLMGLTLVISGAAFVTVNSGSYTASPSAVRTRQRPGDGVPDGTFAVICVDETTVYVAG
jgi:hypothetical protein